MKLKVLLLILSGLCLVITLTSNAQANFIGITYQNESENNIQYSLSEEYAEIENKLDLHSQIGLGVYNFSQYAQSNITLTIIPFSQVKYMDAKDAQLINVSFCEGIIERPDYNVTLQCDGPIVDLTNKMQIKDYPIQSNIKNHSVRRWYFDFSPREFKNNTLYAFRIEYKTKDILVNKGNTYTIFDVDNMHLGSIKVLILPSDAYPTHLPEKATTYLIENKNWIVVVPIQNSEWYFLSFEIIPWYQKFKGFLLSFLIGGIVLFILSLILNDITMKSLEKHIVNRIRSSVYKINKKESNNNNS